MMTPNLPSAVGMCDCKATRINMRSRVSKFPKEIDISLETEFRPLSKEGFPAGIAAEVKILGNRGECFSLEISLESFFEFDKATTRNEAMSYLAVHAPTRVIDVARAYVSSLCSMSALPNLTIPPIAIPPIAVEIDSKI